MAWRRILVRVPNWLGDAIMSLPALRLVRWTQPEARITVLARPWVAPLYRNEGCVDETLVLNCGKGWSDWRGKWQAVQELRAGQYDAAILLQNAFEAALFAWAARIPERIGYRRDGRGPLLTRPIAVPRPGEIPPHETFYYLEMLRRAGWVQDLPPIRVIQLGWVDRARQAGERRWHSLGVAEKPIGISPGAAYGTAKRWPAQRFAQTAAILARKLGAPVAVFGSAGEAGLCQHVAGQLQQAGITTFNWAGRTSLEEFIELAAGCRLFLTNDSGAMHVAAALGVPTVAVFGPTDPTATGPLGPATAIVREQVECAPCKLRHCPIDHRCMQQVPVARVVAAALELVESAEKEADSGHAQENTRLEPS